MKNIVDRGNIDMALVTDMAGIFIYDLYMYQISTQIQASTKMEHIKYGMFEE